MGKEASIFGSAEIWKMSGGKAVGVNIERLNLVGPLDIQAQTVHVAVNQSLGALSEAAKANRSAMVELVSKVWISGVLHKTLRSQTRHSIQLDSRPDAVVLPYDLVVKSAQGNKEQIPEKSSIHEAYDRERGELLVLGEPGSGKTTLLLEIAENLLERARRDDNFPVPVVLNLSAWRHDHGRFDDWLIGQLAENYQIAKKIVKLWIKNGTLLLLLDGLDEVAEPHRASCIRAINDYRRNRQSIIRPLVVCCRTQEYEKLPKLELGGAVEIRPLSRRQVDDYLGRWGAALDGLRSVLADEPELYEDVFSTPLMLDIAMIAYSDRPANELRGLKSNNRYECLWDAYVERMFDRKVYKRSIYRKEKALRWLAWLGHHLDQTGRQVYRIESMQPGDLPYPWQNFLVRWVFAAPSFVIAIVLLSQGFSVGGSILSLGFILAGVFIGVRSEIKPQPVRRLTFQNMRVRWPRILLGTLAGFGLGASYCMLSLIYLMTLFLSMMRAMGEGVLGGLFLAEIVKFAESFLPGLLLSVGLVASANSWFEEAAFEATVLPNHGIRRSARSSILATFFGGIAAAIITKATIGENGRDFENVAITGVSLFSAMISGSIYGGRTVCRHYFLRLLLCLSRRFPYKIAAFLDWSAEQILVQNMQGGWKFVHRTLQDHFAKRYVAQYKL